MEKTNQDLIEYWKEDGILHSEFKNNIDINIDNIEILINLRHLISENEMQYWCSDFKGVKSMSKEARDYSNIHGQDFLHACATVVYSHVTKFIVNTFMMIKNPKVPLKAFTTKEKAVTWLLEIKAKNELN